jgi:RND family efflux transporter MFP subunit
MNVIRARTLSLVILAALLPLAIGCSSQADATDRERQGNRSGGRRSPSIALAASDVAVLGRGLLEAGIPITGDLNPIERVEVRARIEGDLVSVLVREGERVRAGQLLARFDDTELESAHRSAEAELAAARSELAVAEWNLEQAQELHREGAIPEIEVRNAEQRAAAARARVAAAEARVHATGMDLRDTRVVAPFTGVVESRLVSGGESVSRGATLFTIVRNDILELAAAVPARNAANVEPGQRVRFQADGRQFEGTVARVSPTVDPRSRSITVYIQIPNASGALKGGTLARGQIIARTVPDALLLPVAAIRQAPGGGDPFVYRIQDDRITRAPVSLGIVDEARGFAEVLEGLSEGDRVVVGNVGLLGEGMEVQVIGGEQQR